MRYIFSDDDPDVLTQALAEHHEATTVGESSTGGSGLAASNNNNRAVILDIATNDDGGYHVAWASSLSPSWAVLDAQLSQISPPSSSDGGNENDGGAGGANTNVNTNTNNPNPNNNTGNNSSNKPGRLMLRIEGVEGSSGMGSESDSRHSGEAGRHLQGSGSASGGSGTGSKERGKAPEADDYAALVDEFDKRMVTLRKVVSANEERLQKVGIEPGDAEATESQQGLEGGAPTTN